MQLCIDPVHFGLVKVLNLLIGLLHPPMDIVLFVIEWVTDFSVKHTSHDYTHMAGVAAGQSGLDYLLSISRNAVDGNV